MAREQQVVARDFMGLGDTGNTIDGEHFRLLEMNKENKSAEHYFANVAGLETPSYRLLHDPDSTSLVLPRTAIDQPIQNIMTPFPKVELHKLHPLHEDVARRNAGPVAATVNGNHGHSVIGFKGMEYPIWNRTVTMQKYAPLKKEEILFDKARSEKLVPHLLHPSRRQDVVNCNGINPFGSQSLALGYNSVGGGDNGTKQIRNFATFETQEAVTPFVTQTRGYGDLQTAIFAQPLEEQNTSTYVGSNFEGMVPQTMLSLSLPDSKDQAPFISALRAQQTTLTANTSSLARPVGQPPLPGSYLSIPMVANVSAGTGTQTRMLSSGLTGKQTSAQLTIFYDGNVNVYDDIPMEKAQAIMHFAGNGSPWQTEIQNSSAEPGGGFKLFNAMTCQSRPGSPQRAQSSALNLSEKLQQNLQICPPGLNTPSVARKVNQSSPSANKLSECSNANAPSAATPVPAGQAVVPRALPQARKASLTRFFEKRRERVLSKAPYHLKKSLPEQSFLPEERFSSSNYDDKCPTAQDELVDEKAVSTMTGRMEEMTGSFEYASSCDTAEREETRLGTAESRSAVDGEVAIYAIF